MIKLTRQCGRCGYRRIAVLLRDDGWQVNDKHVERLWRWEGLKVPMMQSKKGRLWLNNGACVRLRPEYRDNVWSYDFVHHRTDDGKVFGTLNILDEYSREHSATRVKRELNSTDIVDVLTDLFIIAACLLSSDRTRDLSSSPRRLAHGSTQSDQRPPVSSMGERIL